MVGSGAMDGRGEITLLEPAIEVRVKMTGFELIGFARQLRTQMWV